MRILIVGGSYFAGRVFTMAAAKAGHHVSLINRGRYSMANPKYDITEFKCDRHVPCELSSLQLMEEYDALIDFCAYSPGDIEMVLGNLPCRINQYVFISTADVYERDTGIKTEESRLQTEKPEDEVGLYTYNKMLLEKELKESCRGIPYTIMRPAFIYGPFNYAPRESWYFKEIMQNRPALVPALNSGEFQLVYVWDVANAILKSIGNENAYNEVFNLSAPEIYNYSLFITLLENVSGKKIKTLKLSKEQIIRDRVPLPFPIDSSENELFDGSKAAKKLGLKYSKPEQAMKETYEAFRPVYEK